MCPHKPCLVHHKGGAFAAAGRVSTPLGSAHQRPPGPVTPAYHHHRPPQPPPPVAPSPLASSCAAGSWYRCRRRAAGPEGGALPWSGPPSHARAAHPAPPCVPQGGQCSSAAGCSGRAASWIRLQAGAACMHACVLCRRVTANWRSGCMPNAHKQCKAHLAAALASYSSTSCSHVGQSFGIAAHSILIMQHARALLAAPMAKEGSSAQQLQLAARQVAGPHAAAGTGQPWQWHTDIRTSSSGPNGLSSAGSRAPMEEATWRPNNDSCAPSCSRPRSRMPWQGGGGGRFPLVGAFCLRVCMVCDAGAAEWAEWWVCWSAC